MATVRNMGKHDIKPARGPLSAVITPPGSKSMTNRALIAAALADGESKLTNCLVADDTMLMADALRVLGVRLTFDERNGIAQVHGCGGQLPNSEGDIFCGNAGTVMRFCTALCALGNGRYELDGVERIHQRPIGALVEAIRTLGCGVEYLNREDYPPLVIHAKGLKGGHVRFRTPESSQFVSALLLAAPYAGWDMMIDVVGDIPSVPYLKLTTRVMDMFGVAVVEQYRGDSAQFIIETPQRYKGCELTIEPDASNASYFLAAPAIVGGFVTVEGLGTESLQGDVRFVDILERMGCTVERAPHRLTVRGPEGAKKLRAIDVDLKDMPDIAQTLSVVALFAEGSTCIRNIGSLRIKETDRLSALSIELTKLGAIVEEGMDAIMIHPPPKITPNSIDTYDDHRMAMSFALAGLRNPGVTINNPHVISKTFPDFFERFEAMIGA